MRKAVVLVAAIVGLSMAAYWVVFAQGPGSQAVPPRVIEISAKKYEFTPETKSTCAKGSTSSCAYIPRTPRTA